MALAILLLLCGCFFIAAADNVETRIHYQLKGSESAVDFGRSLKGNGLTLYASAVSGGAPAVYTCQMSYESATTQTGQCTNVFKFPASKDGLKTANEFGKVNVGGTDYIVSCDNQYNFTCANSDIPQRLVGRCYSYDVGKRTTEELATPCPTSCVYGLYADIVFVIDGSGSVGQSSFTKGLQWIVNLTKAFRYDIDAGRIRMGFVPFRHENYDTQDISIKTYFDFRHDILGIGYKSGGETYTKEAIQKATEFFANAGGGNRGKVMIVMTDGDSTAEHKPATVSQNARNAGITIIAIGIGGRVKRSELLDIAGHADRVKEVDNYDALDTIIDSIGETIKNTATAGMEGSDSNSTTELTSCQLGTSIHGSANGLYIGAVGSYSRFGTVAEYRRLEGFPEVLSSSHMNSTEISNFLGASPFKGLEEYFGYSVTTGKFTTDNLDWIVTGAPRYLLKGMVLVYRETPSTALYKIQPPDDNTTNTLWQLGAYFGHSVLSIDVNGDSRHDLIVSAPLYSAEKPGYDEGRVFVYLSTLTNPGPQKWGTGFEPIVLQGDNLPGTRFGMQLTNGGDVDRNGIDDVIISAPVEESTGKASQSGAVYVYYSKLGEGLSDARKQKILGRQVSSTGNTLSQFGWSVYGGADLDRNGYPDLVVSAPSNGGVVFLRSRRIITLTSNMTVTPSTLDVIGCSVNKTITCASVRVCLSAVYQDAPSEDHSFDITYALDLDALVPGDKRLRFLDPKGATVNETLSIDRTQTCKSFNINLNHENMGKSRFEGDFKPIPRITLVDDLSQKHKDKIMSGVLSAGTQTSQSFDWTFDTGCSGTRCSSDLKISATSSDDAIVGPVVLDGNTRLMTVSITMENLGPEHSLYTKLNISSGILTLTVISGPCAEIVDDESDADTGLTVIRYKPSTSLLPGYMPANVKCQFDAQFGFSKFKENASIGFYEINGTFYSGNDSTSDTNLANNQFSFSHTLQYKSQITITQASLPETIYFNSTRGAASSDQGKIKSLEDYAMGENNTNLVHQYSLYNQGPLPLANSRVKLTWPEFTSNGLDLFYLVNVSCEPANACVCNTTGIVNKYNIAPKNGTNGSYVGNYTFTYPVPASAFGFNGDLGCSNSRCSEIFCDMGTINLYQSVKFLAEFKPWVPTFGKGFNSTRIFSFLDLMVSDISPSDAAARKTTWSLMTNSGWYREPVKGGMAWWIIFLAILGGLLLLALAVFGMWKAGFFESKYKNKIERGRASVREATEAGGGPEDDMPEDPGLGQSTADLVDA